MKVLAQWRKLVARLKAIWNAPDDLFALTKTDIANALSVNEVACSTNLLMERIAGISERLEREKASIDKQLSDLRAIVANLREESKRGPLQARSAAQLRQFVAGTGEEV